MEAELSGREEKIYRVLPENPAEPETPPYACGEADRPELAGFYPYRIDKRHRVL